MNMNNFSGMDLSITDVVVGYYWRGHAIEMHWNPDLAVWMYRDIYISFSERGIPKELPWWKGFSSIAETPKYAESFVNRRVDENLYD